MSKSILIIGAGEGLSASMAEKFSSQGYHIGLISFSIQIFKLFLSLPTQTTLLPSIDHLDKGLRLGPDPDNFNF
jgi:hypothetical protein